MSHWECKLKPKKDVLYILNTMDVGYPKNALENWDTEVAKDWVAHEAYKKMSVNLNDYKENFIRNTFDIICKKIDE